MKHLVESILLEKVDLRAAAELPSNPKFPKVYIDKAPKGYTTIHFWQDDIFRNQPDFRIKKEDYNKLIDAINSKNKASFDFKNLDIRSRNSLGIKSFPIEVQKDTVIFGYPGDRPYNYTIEVSIEDFINADALMSNM